VSRQDQATFDPLPEATPVLGPDGKVLHIMAVDVGMKNNQIRCFVKRGVRVTVVPFDYDFVTDQNYDGLFLSNGPGDPTILKSVIERIAKIIALKTKPVFGICLGHQLLALASGAKTVKLLYGNRGHNIPCTDLQTGRCYITSQNHGFAVDISTLTDGWVPYFTNANDQSNEGIMHKTLPYFSVQFHPESTPGPWDTEFLFSKFITSVKDCKFAGKLVPLATVIRPQAPVRLYPKKVLVLGSGGLSIGQAGEFDYSGSQAIKALKEEGIFTILINPNIATIQTSKGLADKVYFLPVNAEYVRKVIKYEKPDGIYCTFGGQTALNVGVQLKSEFEGLGVKVLGTPIETIEITEDRDLFANALTQIGEKMAVSASATTIDQAITVGKKIGYPLIVRAAYALGGLGSGFADNEKELRALCAKAFANSPQVLVEKSMKGWKEVEYEVVRDAADNCITVCNMENFDPLGIHTGESIVVAPSQTLSDDDYMMLRRTAVNVIRHLGVVGECNIQYALNPHSKEYCIIEVNARLSRSSALASKATGYPLAFVAAKLGLGIPLTEVKNNITKKTIACFEPSLDYCVVKIPRWDLKKFERVSTKIGSAMKSVGEVMAIGRNFEETIQKAIRSVDYCFDGFSNNNDIKDIDDELINPSDLRLSAIAHAMHNGYSVEKIHNMTKIDKWFLNRLMNIVVHDKLMSKYTPGTISDTHLRFAKQIGFSDRQIATCLSSTELAIRKHRIERGITPFVKQIDTVAAEFPCYTNYLYTTYSASVHDVNFKEKGIMVLGSGVYRIGSSVEFDWCAVRCIRTLRACGYKTVMINYNPETVSTDYDEADRLYFENLTLERVLDIYELENSSGVIGCMGGQTPNNIALALHREKVKILGTSPEMIDGAENRYKFSRMCDKIGVDQPQWKELTSMEEASAFCENVGYPVLVRPSYVLSGAAMNVVYSEADLTSYLQMAVNVSRDYPVVISKFIDEAKEIELDAVAHDGKLVMHVISEHVENAGVHSGDATLILPPQDLDPETVAKIEVAATKIVDALNVSGPCNIQFIAKNNEIKIIECNVRASRSFPFCSKVLGCDLIELATKIMIGEEYTPYPPLDKIDYVAVKVPQFSFSRLAGADPILGVEMASTGEVACFGKNKYEAYIKALVSTGFKLPKKNILISVGSFKEKQELLPSVKKLHQLGYKIFATSGTADFMSEHSIPVHYLEAIESETNSDQKLEYSLNQHLSEHLVDLYINLPSNNKFRRPASYVSQGYKTRRMAIDSNIPLITNIKCAKLFIEALSRGVDFEIASYDYFTSYKSVIIPGLFDIGTKKHMSSVDVIGMTKNAVAAGFTCLANGPIVNDVEDVPNMVMSAMSLFSTKSYVDYGICVPVLDKFEISAVERNVTHLYIDLDTSKVSSSLLENIFNTWPSNKPIVAIANDSSLATVLLFANLYKRSVHLSQVFQASDVELILMSREQGVNVTFDVSVYNLFLSQEDYFYPFLGTAEDVEFLWQNLEVIDCFSVGEVLTKLANSLKIKNSVTDYDYALNLLLTAVNEKKLTCEDIIKKFSTKPREIFGLAADVGSFIEVEIDRPKIIHDEKWCPFPAKQLYGSVLRVMLRRESACIDQTVVENPLGMRFHGPVRKAPLSIVSSPRKSILSGPLLDSKSPARNRLFSMDVSSKIPEKNDSPRYIADLSRSSVSMNASSFFRMHIVEVQQFERKDLHHLFGVAQEMRSLVQKHGQVNLLNGKIMCSAFWEPSTRTSCSFEAAMTRLGGGVVSINQITSSIAKGESLGDTGNY
jgi:carbamoyl-phosphate synthase/aspartate carbamoyltransferase